MFESLSERLGGVFDRLTKQGALSEADVDTALREVRTALLGIQGLYPGRVKIVTYEGVTYILGILTPAEQDIVTQQVRTTAGVQKVVTLYQNYTPTTNP